MREIITQQLLGHLVEEFKVPPERVTRELEIGTAEIPLDSFAVISLAAAIDDVHGVYLSAGRIAECRSVGDLEDLIRAELERRSS